MKLFITGATGYIGSALCRRWVAEGHDVRALVRPTSRTQELTSLGVSLFPGDITDAASMKAGVKGVDWVVHSAAELDMEAPLEVMESVNVGGSETVAALAHDLGVGRFLSISSIAFFGGSPEDGTPSNESSPIQQPLPTNYSATKHAGELAIRAWQQRGLAVNTVYPSIVYGPPGKKSGANGLLRTLLAERMPLAIAGDRKVSWIYLEDLVEGISRVVDRAVPSRDYLLSGDTATIDEVVRTVCGLGGVKTPGIPVPLWLAGPLLALAAPFYGALGMRLPAGRQGLASLGRHWCFDDSRARAELDWKPRTLGAGLPPTVESLLE